LDAAELGILLFYLALILVLPLPLETF
jgi:hypothetical protein